MLFWLFLSDAALHHNWSTEDVPTGGYQDMSAQNTAQVELSWELRAESWELRAESWVLAIINNILKLNNQFIF